MLRPLLSFHHIYLHIYESFPKRRKRGKGEVYLRRCRDAYFALKDPKNWRSLWGGKKKSCMKGSFLKWVILKFVLCRQFPSVWDSAATVLNPGIQASPSSWAMGEILMKFAWVAFPYNKHQTVSRQIPNIVWRFLEWLKAGYLDFLPFFFCLFTLSVTREGEK